MVKRQWCFASARAVQVARTHRRDRAARRAGDVDVARAHDPPAHLAGRAQPHIARPHHPHFGVAGLQVAEPRVARAGDRHPRAPGRARGVDIAGAGNREAGFTGAQRADLEIARAADRGIEALGFGAVDTDVARAADRGAFERRHRHVDGDLAHAPAGAEPPVAARADAQRAILDADIELVERLARALRAHRGRPADPDIDIARSGERDRAERADLEAALGPRAVGGPFAAVA